MIYRQPIEKRVLESNNGCDEPINVVYHVFLKILSPANGFLNFFLRKVFGKSSCPTNTLGVKLCRKSRLNRLILEGNYEG
jgi:hypothetical protein